MRNFKEYLEMICEGDIISDRAKEQAKQRGLVHQSHNIWKDKSGQEYKWNEQGKKFEKSMKKDISKKMTKEEITEELRRYVKKNNVSIADLDSKIREEHPELPGSERFDIVNKISIRHVEFTDRSGKDINAEQKAAGKTARW